MTRHSTMPGTTVSGDLGINLPAACVQKVNHRLPGERGVSVLIKRDDRLHPVISGNKWRKLKYLLADAIAKQYGHLISMGGAWSNHLHALAWAGRHYGLQTTGIIRGEQPSKPGDTLLDIQRWGMRIEYVNREEFRALREFRHADSPPARQRGAYWIPEGGASRLALSGVAEILTEVEEDYDIITTACGTGATLAGLISALPAGKQAIGFPAIKGGGYLRAEIQKLLADVDRGPATDNWQLNTDYHFGGFARQSPELIKFMFDFEQQTGIPLDPIYTGKMFYGLFDLIQRNHFPPGTQILALHTGGLQGKRGMRAEQSSPCDSP